MDNNLPIGIFDSGVGGLTVVRSIIDQLYFENIEFIGDTFHSPYGMKSISDIKKFSIEIADSLVEKGVKALVIACNSASAASYLDIKNRYDIPVVEVINPTVNKALQVTKNNKIGVIGTKLTIDSKIYENLIAENKNVQVFSKATPELATYVEQGITTGGEITRLVQNYLNPILDQGIDTLVLGCTHYPFLSGVIQYVCGNNVNLVTSSEETTKELVNVLTKKELFSNNSDSSKVTRNFIATGRDDIFKKMAVRFLKID